MVVDWVAFLAQAMVWQISLVLAISLAQSWCGRKLTKSSHQFSFSLLHFHLMLGLDDISK
jgi:hypothetical protein